MEASASSFCCPCTTKLSLCLPNEICAISNYQSLPIKTLFPNNMILLTEFPRSLGSLVCEQLCHPAVLVLSVQGCAQQMDVPRMLPECQLLLSTQAEVEGMGTNIPTWNTIKIDPRGVTVAPEKFSSQGLFLGTS